MVERLVVSRKGVHSGHELGIRACSPSVCALIADQVASLKKFSATRVLREVGTTSVCRNQQLSIRTHPGSK